MEKIVLDPGVLVSAAIAPQGTCGLVLRTLLNQRCEIVVCPTLMAELEEVLLRPKFRRYLSLEQVDLFVMLVDQVANHHPEPVVSKALTEDPDDDYLVALANDARADHLISGDTHLANFVDPRVSVLTPRALLDRIG